MIVKVEYTNRHDSKTIYRGFLYGNHPYKIASYIREKYGYCELLPYTQEELQEYINSGREFLKL